MKNLLTISDLSKSEIQEILDLSIEIHTNKEKFQSTLQGKNIVFSFEKPSLRTKIATEVAINHLGGNVIHIAPENFFEGKILFSDKKNHSISGRESLKDTVKNVSQWCDAIFARVFSHQTLLDITSCSTIPIINALCDKYHPMQALSDLLTIQNQFGKTEKVAVTFVGDANNVAFSLLEILLLFGHDVRFAGPKNYFFSEEQQNYFSKLAKDNNGNILFTTDVVKAIKDSNVIYTDTFVSMGEEDIFEEKMKHFSNYQVNSKLFSYADKNACFMHCLPAHRNIEVTDEIIDGKHSVVYKQAQNRMVVSKGVFIKIFNI